MSNIIKNKFCKLFNRLYSAKYGVIGVDDIGHVELEDGVVYRLITNGNMYKSYMDYMSVDDPLLYSQLCTYESISSCDFIEKLGNDSKKVCNYMGIKMIVNLFYP